MSWMSPLTVPITTLPTGSAPVSASSGRRIAMPAFIALAARRTSGTNRMPSRKSMPTIFMPATSASSRTRVAEPAAAEQDVRPLDDLGRHAVVEVVVHLLDELVVGQGREVDLLVLVLRHPAVWSSASRGSTCGTVPYDGTADRGI